MNFVLRILLLVFIGMALLIGGCVWTVKQEIYESMGTKIDVARYSEIVEARRVWGEGYKFLPKVVPFETEEASFVHTPHFLQGGDYLTLRVRLPAAHIAKLLTELEQSGRTEVKTFTPAPTPRCYPKWNLTEDDMEKRSYESITELPSDFRVFLFRTDLKDIEKNWNHNFLALTAVSVERREVVYHVENW
ncbi:hypothetical protein [Rariglobus hedericola]|uniref:Lipoprotein n=1 Tax=Rariglobus hedericola TaxID=2597822 RepID=A0A556QPD8_9BACT|nr:hypothetical protein [Rariglobus hedericola]TSJ78497.1 hypothetical protein FPL22_04135 [Rariglobus hedericola]